MIIDGKAIAKQKEEDLRSKIKDLKKIPKLAIVLVGDDPASKIYVNLKVKKAQELGIETEVRQDLNTDADGIIVQLPGGESLINSIPLEKDVDGLKEGSPFLPATVKAVLVIASEAKQSSHDDGRLLRRFTPRNDTWVVVGQGRLVGKPLADFLEKNGRKVIRCRSTTPNLKEETYKGDILVCATGVDGLIKKNMVKPGAIIIDCGSPKPEVDSEVYEIAGAYTPVPGGIGPLTVISLLENLIEAVKITP